MRTMRRKKFYQLGSFRASKTTDSRVEGIFECMTVLISAEVICPPMFMPFWGGAHVEELSAPAIAYLGRYHRQGVKDKI